MIFFEKYLLSTIIKLSKQMTKLPTFMEMIEQYLMPLAAKK